MSIFAIERHAYSPEQNKLHFFRGGRLAAPGITSIREAREKLLSPVKPGKLARVEVTHTNPEHKICDTQYYGRIRSMIELIEFKKTLRTRHNLPDAKISITQLKLIG